MPKNCYTHMSVEERETLSLGLAQGQSLRTMARVLKRAPSTVSREHARNARGNSYRACMAQSLAAARARQPRRPRKLLDPWLWHYVQAGLRRGCSPEQIVGRLRHEYPDDMRKHLSSETIYVARCTCCHVETCAPSCWPHCVRRARRAVLARVGRIDVAASRT